jgi:hypothetical protein
MAFLVITSSIKNETRVIEKKISTVNKKVLLKKKDINETQLDFYYLTSPAEIETRLNKIGFENYEPISFSRIFFNINNFIKLNKKISNLKNLNEEKTQKK